MDQYRHCAALSTLQPKRSCVQVENVSGRAFYLRKQFKPVIPLKNYRVAPLKDILEGQSQDERTPLIVWVVSYKNVSEPHQVSSECRYQKWLVTDLLETDAIVHLPNFHQDLIHLGELWGLINPECSHRSLRIRSHDQIVRYGVLYRLKLCKKIVSSDGRTCSRPFQALHHPSHCAKHFLPNSTPTSDDNSLILTDERVRRNLEANGIFVIQTSQSSTQNSDSEPCSQSQTSQPEGLASTSPNDPPRATVPIRRHYEIEPVYEKGVHKIALRISDPSTNHAAGYLDSESLARLSRKRKTLFEFRTSMQLKRIAAADETPSVASSQKRPSILSTKLIMLSSLYNMYMKHALNKDSDPQWVGRILNQCKRQFRSFNKWVSSTDWTVEELDPLDNSELESLSQLLRSKPLPLSNESDSHSLSSTLFATKQLVKRLKNELNRSAQKSLSPGTVDCAKVTQGTDITIPETFAAIPPKSLLALPVVGKITLLDAQQLRRPPQQPTELTTEMISVPSGC